MIFNSFQYMIFLPVVFLLHWLIPSRHRWILLLIASYYFYMSWNAKYVVLILFTTLVSYLAAILIEATDSARKKKIILFGTLITCLGVLGVFKYFNFFAETLSNLFQAFSIPLHPVTLKLLLPVGISFYTFQTLSYVIDVYRGTIRAERHFGIYATFVSFFPQLVAGPIERASNLLPQFSKPRSFDYSLAVDGMRQILWGYVKKLVIADNCATYVEAIYADPGSLGSQHLVMGLLLFFLQVYGDFSGYSDMAIGSAKLFGIRLMRNFDVPMFSRDISEYWRRWHISLNSWFFQYVFFPLGGFDKKWKIVRNVIVVFGLCGLWHGANWTYVCWGLYFGLLTMPYLLKIRMYKDSIVAKHTFLPTLKETRQMATTFALVLLGSPLFRCQSLGDAGHYYASLFTNGIIHGGPKYGHGLLTLIVLLFAVEWIQRKKEHPLQIDAIPWRWVRWSIYYGLLVLIFFYYISTTQFLYFQF